MIWTKLWGQLSIISTAGGASFQGLNLCYSACCMSYLELQ